MIFLWTSGDLLLEDLGFGDPLASEPHSPSLGFMALGRGPWALGRSLVGIRGSPPDSWGPLSRLPGDQFGAWGLVEKFAIRFCCKKGPVGTFSGQADAAGLRPAGKAFGLSKLFFC